MKEVNEEVDLTKDIDQTQSNSRRTSKVWKFFDVMDEEKYLARCSLCMNIMTFRSAVSNLMKHIKTKHPYSYSQIRKEIDEQTKEAINNLLKQKAEMEEESEGVKKIFVSSNGKIYEIEDELDEFSETEQINKNETEVLVERIQPPKKRKRSQPKHIKSPKCSIEPKSSSEKSLEHFSKYLISILKELPQKISSELQLKFVQLALEAKLKYENEGNNFKFEVNIEDVEEI